MKFWTTALTAALVLGTAGFSIAHQTGFALPEGEGAILYIYSDHNSPSVWQETNGKVSDGVYADNADRQAGIEPIGLHLRGACYGTYTQTAVDNWNASNCGSTPEDPYDVFSYLPFDGTAQQCSSLARAIELGCDACEDDACRELEGCNELCGDDFDGGAGQCSIDEAYFPADELLVGSPPAYGVPGGNCHAG